MVTRWPRFREAADQTLFTGCLPPPGREWLLRRLDARGFARRRVAGSSAGAMETVKKNVLPSPARLSIQIRPFIRPISLLQSRGPSRCPKTRVIDPSPWWNGRKMTARCDSGCRCRCPPRRIERSAPPRRRPPAIPRRDSAPYGELDRVPARLRRIWRSRLGPPVPNRARRRRSGFHEKPLLPASGRMGQRAAVTHWRSEKSVDSSSMRPARCGREIENVVDHHQQGFRRGAYGFVVIALVAVQGALRMSPEKPSMPLSGVLISWLMLARIALGQVGLFGGLLERFFLLQLAPDHRGLQPNPAAEHPDPGQNGEHQPAHGTGAPSPALPEVPQGRRSDHRYVARCPQNHRKRSGGDVAEVVSGFDGTDSGGPDDAAALQGGKPPVPGSR